MQRDGFSRYLTRDESDFLNAINIPERTTNLLLKLLADIDFNKADRMGRDPFSMRDKKYERVVDLTQLPIDLKSCVEQFNLSESDLTTLDFNSTIDEQKKIAKVAFFIWLGSPLDYDKRTIETIETWRQHEPNMPIIVWTDMVSKNMPDEERKKHQASLDWCKQNNIVLLNSDEILLPNLGEVKQHYLYERQRPNYGGATDILRVPILKFFGGIYSDIDTGLTAKIPIVNAPQGMMINRGKRTVLGKGGENYEIKEGRGNMMNDLIFSSPHNAYLDDLLLLMEKQYKLSYDDLLAGTIRGLQAEYETKLAEYRKKPMWDFDLSVEPAKPSNIKNDRSKRIRYTTIDRTGPGIYANIENKFSDEQLPDITIPKESFRFESRQTWIPTIEDKDNRPTINLNDEALLTLAKSVITDLIAESKYGLEKIDLNYLFYKLSRDDYVTLFQIIPMLLFTKLADTMTSISGLPICSMDFFLNADKYLWQHPGSRLLDKNNYNLFFEIKDISYDHLVMKNKQFFYNKEMTNNIRLFENCQLKDADFSESIFKNVSFMRVDLSRANFSNATLINTPDRLDGFLGPESIHPLFYDVDLRGANFDGAKFIDDQFTKIAKNDNISKYQIDNFNTLLDSFDKTIFKNEESRSLFRQSILNDILKRVHHVELLKAAYNHPYYNNERNFTTVKHVVNSVVCSVVPNSIFSSFRSPHNHNQDSLLKKINEPKTNAPR